MREKETMDKHYGWQEGRGSNAQGRQQNGQRWNEGYRDDDREIRASGGDLDREDYIDEGEEYGGQSRGGFGGRNQGRSSQGGGSFSGGQSRGSQWGGGRGESGRGGQSFGGNQSYGERGFSGGHYGGFANEGFGGQGNYGGNRGFPNQGYSGQRFNQGSSGQSRGQNYGQTFGQGYAGGSEYGGQAIGSGNQGFGDASQWSRGQSYGSGQSYGQGRGFAGRGPKGYQRSDDRVKEQLSDRLMDDDDIDASEITVEVKNGEVTLTGTVNSREEKRAAEDIAEQSPGVREVQNLLRVSHASSSTQSNQGASSRSQGTSNQAMSSQSKSRGSERE
jgi:osmotically-inducible protein OsmY